MNAFNWDTVYGVSAERISKALAAQTDQMAAALDYAEDGFALSGQFETWAVAQGSADTLLKLRLAFAHCVLTRPDGSVLSPFMALIEVQVRLELLTTTPAAAPVAPVSSNLADVPTGWRWHGGGPAIIPIDSGDGDMPSGFVSGYQMLPAPAPAPPPTTQLCFRAQHAGVPGVEPMPGVVSLINQGSSLSAQDAQENDLPLVETAVLNWLTKQAATLTFVLATISTPPGLPAWLAPVQSRFCIKSAGGRTMFFVLSVMDGREIPADDTNVDDDLLKGLGGDAWEACFYLAPELFFQHVVMPALPAVLGNGCSVDRFSYADGVISAATLDLPEVSVSGDPFTYQPQIDRVTLNLAVDKLHCVIAGSCGLKLGILMRFSCESWNPFGFDPAAKVLRFTADPNPQTSHDIPAGGKVLAGVLGFLGGLFTSGPAGAIAGTAVSQVLINDVSGSINNKVQFQITLDAPTFVQWFGAGAFTMTEAALNNGVVLKGHLG